jgi:hypothetical protein
MYVEKLLFNERMKKVLGNITFSKQKMWLKIQMRLHGKVNLIYFVIKLYMIMKQ